MQRELLPAIRKYHSPGGAPVHVRGTVLGVVKKLPDGTWKGFCGAGFFA
jgi:hypothetical protein